MLLGKFQKLLFLGLAIGFLTMCTTPESKQDQIDAAVAARRDSIREVRCPRLFSSAAEYYKNRDWRETVRVYGELVDLGCDRDNPQEVYLFYAIAFEYLGLYDSSEYVLLRGLQILPDNIDLRKRLAYAYQKQGKINNQVEEYDRLSFLAPDDINIKAELAKLYGEQKRYEDQITVLKELLKLDPTNEVAQGDLAIAYELSGRDPLDVYKSRFDNSPENVSYGLNYADRLINADRTEEAIIALKQVLDVDPSSKVAYRKLAIAYDSIDLLDEAVSTYEQLFKLDPRDFRIAIKITNILVDNQDFGAAFNWADKASMLSNEGEAFGAMGKVYDKAFQACRTAEISMNDRIVASLAYTHYLKAEKKGFTQFSRFRIWLKENEVLFGKAQWFMLDDDQKNKGFVKPAGDCYNWIEERLEKDINW